MPTPNKRPLAAVVERAYAAARLLSVDVAGAALGGGMLAVHAMAARPRPAFYAVLPAAVWVVYTLDHLIDARRMGPTAATPRHRFHVRHAAALWAVWVPVAIATGVVGLVELSWPGVAFGLGMAALVGLHETIVKLAGSRASPLLVKELGVAVIFTAGTWGLPTLLRLVRVGHPPWRSLVLAGGYLLLAGVNLVVFSLFEARRDAAAGQTSFVRGIGRPAAARVAAALLAAAVVLVTTIVPRSPPVDRAAAGVLLAMAAGLGLILWRPRWFVRRERYRTLGDGVFLFPLAMAIIGRPV